MKQFRLNKRAFPLPTCWADLRPEQVLAVVPYIYDDRTSARVLLAVLHAVVDIPKGLFRKLTPLQVLELCHELDWVWEEELGACEVREIRHRGRVYLLPEANLADAVVVEYAMANVYFRSFVHPKRPQAKAFDQLIATLCRPQAANLNEADPNWDGQRRERYNGKLAEVRAKELADLPLASKIVVLKLFLAAQRFIHRAYHDLYKKQEAAPHPAAPVPVSDGTETLELIAELAERGTYGTYEQVAYTSVHTIFFNLARQARRRREQERDA